VFLRGVTPAGAVLLDHPWYLPETWAADLRRREKTRVPPAITFQTKPPIAAARVARSTVRFDWITGDEECGRDGGFLDALENGNQRDLVEVPADTAVWPDRPLRQTPDECVWQVSQLAETIPAKAWRVIQLREDAKGQLGMAQYEARSWTSWHHPMSLVALAHLYVVQVRRDLKRKTPELTLDTAMRLLRASLPRPQLTLKDAEDLVDYYLDRNKQATKSHRKTWLARHPNVIPRK